MQTDRQIQMKLETYRAKSLQEALRLVRSELGPDAEVVHSREIPGRFFGWFGAGCIEVTAASGEEVARGEISEVIGVRTERPNGKANRALPETIEESLRCARNRTEDSLVEQIVRREKGGTTPIPEELQPCFEELVQLGMPTETAAWLLEEMAIRNCAADRGLRAAAEVLAEHLAIRSLGEVLAVGARHSILDYGPRCVALLGDVGAGKSCAASKIAARLASSTRLCVGLAAWTLGEPTDLSPLAKVAAAYGLPFAHGADTQQWGELLGRLAACDLLLIEISPRLAKDNAASAAARELLARRPENERLLAVAADADAREWDRPPWKTWRPTGRVLSGMDRAKYPARITPALLTRPGGAPLIGISTGPSLAGEFEAANPRRTANWLLGLAAESRFPEGGRN